MKKKSRNILSFAVYAAAMCGYAFFAYMPYAVARFAAFRLADVWRCLDRRHEKLAMDQSRDRLGISAAEARRLARDNYRHYAMLVLEICRMNRMPVAEVESRTRLNGSDAVFRDLLAEGKGLVVVTGHLGNWEWGATILGRMGAITGALARPLGNPYLDRFVNRLRERGGVKVWSKFGGIRNALAALRRGEGFVAVADQDGSHFGVPAPFLGKEGSTMTMPVDLAMHTGAPILVGALMRDKGTLRFTAELRRVHRPNPDADPATERLRLLTEVNADLSDIIRQYPEQWIWIHKRWRKHNYRGGWNRFERIIAKEEADGRSEGQEG